MNQAELIEQIAEWLCDNFEEIGGMPWDTWGEPARKQWRDKAKTLVDSVLVPAGLGWNRENSGYDSQAGWIRMYHFVPLTKKE